MFKLSGFRVSWTLSCGMLIERVKVATVWVETVPQ